MVAQPSYLVRQRMSSVLVAVLIASMPLTMLTDFGRTSTVFYILTGVCAIICMAKAGGFSAVLNDLKEYRGLALALFLRCS